MHPVAPQHRAGVARYLRLSGTFPWLCTLTLGTLLTPFICGVAHAEASVTLQLPSTAKASSAVAVAEGVKVETPGTVDGAIVHFGKLLADTPYNIRLTLADGMVVQGVNLNWYDEEPAKADADPLDDQDKKDINAILQIPSFYNKSNILHLNGDHTRATALVELIRDKDFVEGAGQVIWRVELYYFKQQFGGWEKVQQQDKIIRRERFKSRAEYESTVSKIRWSPTLGGIRLDNDHPQKTVKLEAKDLAKHP